MTKPGKEHNPDQKQHTEDLFFKAANEFFGEEALTVFQIPEKMKRPAPTESIHLEARRMYEDFNIEMESGVWFHFEFESDRIRKKDLRRFREYESVIGNTHQVDVVTYVVCTANVRNLMSCYQTGINTYHVKIIRLNHQNADDLFQRVLQMPVQKLSRKDLLAIVFSPFMSGAMSIYERIKKGFSCLNNPNLQLDSNDRSRMMAMLYMFAVKLLTNEELEKVKEEISMTALGQMLMEDGIKKGMETGIKKGMATGIKKGETLFATLTRKMIQDGRTNDLQQATLDENFKMRMYQEYGIISGN